MPFYPLVWQRILCLRFWNNLWMPPKKIHVVMNTNLEKQWKSGDKNKGLNFQITWSGLWNCWQPEDGPKTLREKTHVLRPWPTTCRWSLNTPRLLIFQNHIYCMCICKYTHIATMIRQSVPPNHKTQVPTSPNHERWVYEASVPAICVEYFFNFLENETTTNIPTPTNILS